MGLCHMRTCSTIEDQGRQPGITVTSVKDLSLKPVTTSLVDHKFTIVMEESATQGFS